jgi:N-dimethylarginine dimethylaminohydrolase
MSRMHRRERRDEVAHFTPFFEARGYHPIHLPERVAGSFEGMGDALWHPGRYLLWGGYGFRTDLAVYSHLGGLLEVPILGLELVDPEFYHLDTALCLLDEETALWYPEAFSPASRSLVRAVFDRLIPAPEREARRYLACNAHSPGGQHVLIHEACETSCERLAEAGYTPVPIDLSEFLKAGGSVYCMKQMFW